MENQLPKITYLFGAGASAISLPTIKQLPERILFIKEYIDKNYQYNDEETMTQNGLTFKVKDAKEFFLEGFDKLYIASRGHSTVDTYAKRLFLTSQEQEAKELAFFLAVYFNLEQKIKDIDPRYNTFLISILDNSAYDFPDNLKFLSWNYDLQLEMAYHKLIDRSSPIVELSKFSTQKRSWNKNKFSSIKINGSCNIKGSGSESLYHLTENLLATEPAPNDIMWALKYGFYYIKNRRSGMDAYVNINFAWRKDEVEKNQISDLHMLTEVLVVIGYSFPFFNRDVDRKIIRAMSNLKKIYIQDLNPDNISFKFLSILPDWKKREIEIIPVNNVDEFFLPPEL